MTNVEITNGGHQVKVSHEGADLVYVVEKAQALWDATKAPRTPTGFDGKAAVK